MARPPKGRPASLMPPFFRARGQPIAEAHKRGVAVLRVGLPCSRSIPRRASPVHALQTCSRRDPALRRLLPDRVAPNG